jgi:hypothetical protein
MSGRTRAVIMLDTNFDTVNIRLVFGVRPGPAD